ncbi:MAG: DUF4214 domain-containing protein [Acidimicrobiales bacterium]
MTTRARFRLPTTLLLSMLCLTASIVAGAGTGPAAAAPRPNAASLQVERLYWAYFDRAPDAAGLSFWTGRRLAGASLDSIADAFGESEEFTATYGPLDDAAFVDLVYRNVLDRSPDTAGAAFWRGQLASRSRGAVMVGFSESVEFAVQLGHLDPGQVERLYRAYFLRAGDAAGLGYWREQQLGGMSLAAISEVFARSPEFVSMYGSLSDADFVALVYRNVLRREPDTAGLTFWTEQLRRRTMTRGAVMVGFSESPEFSGRPADPVHQTIGGCQLFPSDSFWYADVTSLPVHPSSDAFVNRIGRTAHAHPDFGADYDGTGAFGIPYNVVAGSGLATPVTFLYRDESDPGPYPVPRDAAIERGSDAHLLVVDTDTCVLHELFAAHWNGSTISAGSGARWDLASNAMRPDGWTSADAAGLPILPGLVRYDEVASGTIDHAIRFTAPITDNSYVWPASHQAGSDGNSNPPMGSWLRLKSSVDLESFTGQSRVIVEALQQHGAILADNGSAWYLSGAPDDRWDNDDLDQLKSIDGSMFEFIDASSLQVGADSMAANQ